MNLISLLGVFVLLGLAWLLSYDKKIIPFKGEINLKTEGPKIVAFVGPTGVGKTTTIAKVAADYIIRKNKKVALVSLDTYRLGAVDQLEVYGDIMRLPVEVAEGSEELREIVKRHLDKDLILKEEISIFLHTYKK